MLLGCQRDSEQVLRHIRSQGGLRVALDPVYPPFEFVDATGAVVGLDVDLAYEIGRRLGVDVHLVSVGYDGLYDALTVGKADVIISALYPDPWRTAGFIFTRHYFNAGEVLLVPRGSPIDEPVDLAGDYIGVVFGSAGHLEALRWEKMIHPPPTVVPWDSSEQVLAMLLSGQASAAVVDNISALEALSGAPNLQVITPSITDEVYVIAGRQENSALIEKIDEILQQMQADGTLDALISEWMQ